MATAKRKLKSNQLAIVKHKPIIALCYDFDRTLSRKEMQEYSLIPRLGEKAEDFWKETNTFAKENKMDQILSYMRLILDKSRKRSQEIALQEKDFKNMGKAVELFDGVEGWFDRINKYAEQKGLIVEHYVISAGLKEIIEGTSISNHFKEIFASCFLYDANKVPMYIKQAVNYTQKTQYLFRISKGCLDLSDNDGVNKNITHDDRKIPFRNFIYLGDSQTDIPAMRLIKKENGHSIGVYDPKEKGLKVACELITDERINFFAPADYREDKALDLYVKKVIDKIGAEEAVAKENNKQRMLISGVDEFKRFLKWMNGAVNNESEMPSAIAYVTEKANLFKKEIEINYVGDCCVANDIISYVDRMTKDFIKDLSTQVTNNKEKSAKRRKNNHA